MIRKKPITRKTTKKKTPVKRRKKPVKRFIGLSDAESILLNYKKRNNLIKTKQ
jgi:hypothetical protein